MCEEKVKSICVKVFSPAGFFVIFMGISLFMTITVRNDVERIHEKYEKQNTAILQEIAKSHPETAKIEESKDDFMKEFYTAQGNWLNIWMVIISFFIAVMGIIFPVMFKDQMEKYEKDLEKIKDDAKDDFEKIKDDADSVMDKLDKTKIEEIEKKIEELRLLEESFKQLSMKITCVEEDLKQTKDDFKNKLKLFEYKPSKTIEKIKDENEAYSLFNQGLDEKDPKKAIEYYKKAIAIKEDFYEAYGNIGILYYELGNYRKSVEYSKKVLKIKPNQVNAYYNIGFALRNLAQTLTEKEEKIKTYNEAINNFKEAVKFKDDYLKAYFGIGIACHELADILTDKEEKTKTYKESIENYKKSLQNNLEDADSLYNISGVYCKLGDYSQAIEYCKKAIELKPEETAYHYNLVEAYIFNKQPEEALKELKIFNANPSGEIVPEDKKLWNDALDRCNNGKAKDKLHEEIKKLFEKKE